MAELVGALIITYILTRAVNSMAKKRTNPTKAALITFFIVAAVALLLTSFTMSIGKGFIIYIPCLMLWLIIDLVRAKKTPIKDQGFYPPKGETIEPSIERPKIFACTYCGTEYNPKDYREDAPEWLCPQCAKPVPKE